MLDTLRNTISKDTKFELKGSSLKVQPTSEQEFQLIISKANQQKWEYFTHNPYLKSNSKYVLKDLPNTTECDTIQAAFQENEVHIMHKRQMTKTYTDETGATTRPIPVWVLTTNNSKNTETKLKNITGLLHFKITIEPLRNKKQLYNAWDVKVSDTKPLSVIYLENADFVPKVTIPGNVLIGIFHLNVLAVEVDIMLLPPNALKCENTNNRSNLNKQST